LDAYELDRIGAKISLSPMCCEQFTEAIEIFRNGQRCHAVPGSGLWTPGIRDVVVLFADN
jgi:hypothetical protein